MNNRIFVSNFPKTSYRHLLVILHTKFKISTAIIFLMQLAQWVANYFNLNITLNVILICTGTYSVAASDGGLDIETRFFD